MGALYLGIGVPGYESERAIRAGLGVSTQLIGPAFVRYVWKVDPFASMSDDEVMVAIAPNVQHFIDGNITLNGRRRRRPLGRAAAVAPPASTATGHAS